MVIKVDYSVSPIYINTNVSPIYIKVDYGTGGGGGAVWGDITGTLSDQLDLQAELDAKLDIPTGTTLEYIDGTGALQTFPLTLPVLQEVRNQTGGTLAAGTVVYINGATGNKPTVAKAIATGDSTSAQTLGMIQSAINNNGVGYVVVIGTCSNLDTSAYTEGDQLYLSGTVAGGVTTTKPYAPTHLVYVGIVTRSHPTLGTIEVRVQNGYEMDELHNVSAQNPSNNDGLFYNTTTSLWEKKQISTALGYTPVPTTRTLTINGTGYDLSTDRSWTVADTNIYTTDGTLTADRFVTMGSFNLYFERDIRVYGVRVGRGGSNSSSSTVLGNNSSAGVNNVIIGYQAGNSTTGFSNVAVGYVALFSNVSANWNTAIGSNSLYFNTGTGNTAVGLNSMLNNTTGTYNTAIGFRAGQYITGNGQNQTSTNSIYVGVDTKASASGNTNEIVIGYQETGLGSNTTIIGNSSTVTTAIRGRLLLGTTTDSGSYQLDANGAGRFTGSLLVNSSSSINASAILQADSTTKGFLKPRMTTTERNAISTPATGLSVYNTTTNTNDYYNGTAWVSSQAAITDPVTGTGTSGQVSYWTGTSTQTGSANFVWNNATNGLTVGGTTTSDSGVQFRFVGSSNNSRIGVYDTNKAGVYLGSVAGVPSIYAYNYTTGTAPALKINEFGGNVLINSTSDGGQRLQVNGDTLLKGSGNTSASTALTVQNSDATLYFRVRNDGQVLSTNGYTVGGTGSVAGIFSSDNTNFPTVIIRSSANTTTTAITDIALNNSQGDVAITSGTRTLVNVSRGFNPTSGTGIYNLLLIGGFTINQTGGASGITRGLYVQPTLTAAADWRSIEWSNSTGWGLYGAGTANNYLNGNLLIGSTTSTGEKLQVTGTARVTGNFRIDANIRDNRDNNLIQQSASTVSSNRDIEIGNGTYGRAMITAKQFSITTGTHPSLGAYSFYFLGQDAGGTTAGSVYFKPAFPSSGNINAGDFIIDLSAGTGTGRQGRVGIGTTSPTAIVDMPASTTANATLRIRSGTAPTTPNDGDIWFDGTDLKMRIGGVTKTFTLT